MGLLEQLQQYHGEGISPITGLPTGASELERLAEERKRREIEAYEEESRRIYGPEYHEGMSRRTSPEAAFFLGGDRPDSSLFAPVDAVAPAFGILKGVVKAAPALARTAIEAATKAVPSLYSPGKIVGGAPNKLTGYYSGDVGKLAAVGTGGLKTAVNTLKQYISPQASTNFNIGGLTTGAQKIVADSLGEMNRLEKLYKSSGGKLSDSDMELYSELGKTTAGQIGYNLLIGKQGKANIPIIEKWKDAVYHKIDNFTQNEFMAMREKGTKIGKQASDKTMKEAYEIIANTWKSKLTKSPLDEKTLMAVKKNRGPKSTGVHDLDAITSEQGKLLDAVLTANDGNFSSSTALADALRKGAITADGKKYRILKTTDDGVWIQVSGYRGSGFVEGGTNAIIKVNPDRRYTIFTSDEHDMLGVVPPGYDRLVTVLPPWGVDKFAKVRKKGVSHPRGKVTEAREYLKRVKKETKPKAEKSTTPQFRTSLPAKLTKAQRKVAEEMASYKAPMGAKEYARFGARRAAPLAGAGGLLYYNED
jgi:hypothetical protein